jgi:DNA-directed RNA polymerase specialized sigma24 family protein
MTLQEIGAVLGKPVETIKSQHRRGVGKLREILESMLESGNAPNYQP